MGFPRVDVRVRAAVQAHRAEAPAVIRPPPPPPLPPLEQRYLPPGLAAQAQRASYVNLLVQEAVTSAAFSSHPDGEQNARCYAQALLNSGLIDTQTPVQQALALIDSLAALDGGDPNALPDRLSGAASSVQQGVDLSDGVNCLEFCLLFGEADQSVVLLGDPSQQGEVGHAVLVRTDADGTQWVTDPVAPDRELALEAYLFGLHQDAEYARFEVLTQVPVEQLRAAGRGEQVEGLEALANQRFGFLPVLLVAGLVVGAVLLSGCSGEGAPAPTDEGLAPTDEVDAICGMIDEECSAQIAEVQTSLSASTVQGSWRRDNLVWLNEAIDALEPRVRPELFATFRAQGMQVDTATMFNGQWVEESSTLHLSGQEDETTFKGTVAHELLHVYLGEHPEVVEEFAALTGWVKDGDGWKNPGTGPTPYARGELSLGGQVLGTPEEDLAESFALLMFGVPPVENEGFTPVSQDRIDFIKSHFLSP